MGKNPMTCKHSINFDGAYICRLELLPCARVKKCALETLDDMAKAASECINAPRNRRKGAAKEG